MGRDPWRRHLCPPRRLAGSTSGAEAGAGAGGVLGKSAPVSGGPPSDTESDMSGRTRAREKPAAGARRGAMPRPTISELSGAGGGDKSEWNQSSGGSVASSSTGGAPTTQHQGRRASSGSRREGGAGANKKVPGNSKGKIRTVNEQVALCEALKLVAQRSEMGANWSKDGPWDTFKEDFVKRIPKSLKPSDLKGRWSERKVGSIKTQFDRKIAPDERRFALFFKVVSEKKQPMGGLTEEDLVRAGAVLFSGVSAYQAVRQDECSDDERQRQAKARVQRTGHVVSCACIPMWRVLEEMDTFSQAATDADAVADRFYGIGGHRDVDGGDDGNGGGDKPSSGKHPALLPRLHMGVRAAKRMPKNKEDMQESANILCVKLVRTRMKMGAMVLEAAKQTQLESKRAAAAFFSLAENKGTDNAKTFFEAMRKDMFNVGIAAIIATAPAAVVSGADAVRGALPSTKAATAAGASAAAAAWAAVAAGGGKEPVVASSDDSDATNNVAKASRPHRRGSAERVRLARGHHAMTAKSKVEQAGIYKN